MLLPVWNFGVFQQSPSNNCFLTLNEFDEINILTNHYKRITIIDGWNENWKFENLVHFSHSLINFLYFVSKRILFKRNEYLYKSLQRSYLRRWRWKKNRKIRLRQGGCRFIEKWTYIIVQAYLLLYFILE